MMKKKILGKKTIFALLFAAIFAFLLAAPAEAQINGFNSGTFVATGNSNTVPLDTNFPSVNIRKIPLVMISGLTNSLGTATGSVYLSWTTNITAGSTLVGQFTYTGSAAFTTNFSLYATNPPLYTIFQAGMGTNSGTWFMLYGP